MERMRNGVGDSLPGGPLAGRGGDAPAGAAAGGRRHQFSGALRNDGGKPHAGLGRDSARGGDHCRGGAGTSARAGGMRRLQHGGDCFAGEGTGIAARRRHPVRNALLQQADAGRIVPALQGHRRGGRDPDRALQCGAPNGRQHRARHARAARGNRKHRRREGSVGGHQPDRHDSRPGSRRSSRCSPETTRWPCRRLRSAGAA